MGLIPGSERFPGEGHGSSPQYSCLKNPMDRGAWQSTVHRVRESWTLLNDLASVHACNLYYCLCFGLEFFCILNLSYCFSAFGEEQLDFKSIFIFIFSLYPVFLIFHILFPNNFLPFVMFVFSYSLRRFLNTCLIFFSGFYNKSYSNSLALCPFLLVNSVFHWNHIIFNKLTNFRS